MRIERFPDPTPDLPTLFEAWMGMSEEEWEALGIPEPDPED